MKITFGKVKPEDKDMMDLITFDDFEEGMKRVIVTGNRVFVQKEQGAEAEEIDYSELGDKYDVLEVEL